jgi:hypothetical protein
MSHDPYIVIGTGRSGSSTVAGILHNKMEVFMGQEFRKPDEKNPDGFWEDVEFASPNWKFLNGKINYPEWIEKIFAVIAKRKNQGIPWGFKDPDATHFLGMYLSFFKNPRIIRCQRKKELVVASLIKSFGHTKEYAKNLWDMKETILDYILADRDCLIIYFDERKISDVEIITAVGEKWNGGNNYQVEVQAR